MPVQWNAALKHLPTRYGTLAYFEFGSGNRPLLLLHGFPDTPQTFESLVDAACRAGYHCFVPFLPGYGDSALPRPGGASIRAVARMLNDFLGHVATQQTVRIVGHDWGSILAQMLCGLHQEGRPMAYRMDRVVLAAVPPLRTFLRQINPRQMMRSRYMAYFQVPGACARIRREDFTYIRTLWRRWSPSLEPNHPQLERVIACLRRPQGLEQATACYRALINPARLLGATEPLKQLRLMFSVKPWPALILVGSEDECIGPEMYRGGEKAFPHPDSRQEVLPGVGHFLHLEQPEGFHQRVLDFLG
jgi:pimeloyl-ACP methyl ester carboxylesterase